MKDKQKNPNAVRLGKLRWQGISKDEISKQMKEVAKYSPVNKKKSITSPRNVENPLTYKNLTKHKRIALGLPAEVKDIGSGGRDQIREVVRTRDNHTCQKCGKRWIAGQRRLDVHHLEENMLGKNRMKGVIKYDKENMDKLITFCHKCHFGWHVDKRKEVMDSLLSPTHTK